MRWISEEKVFADVLSYASEIAKIDARSQPRKLTRLIFDSSELCTRVFLGLLQTLMRASGDGVSYYIVLNPDPIKYFVAYFKKYPLLEIRVDDPPEDYLAALNEDPGGSPADAVGINWSEYVILPPSMTWFLRGLRDDDNNQGGHIWIPLEWTQRVTQLYPYAKPG